MTPRHSGVKVRLRRSAYLCTHTEHPLYAVSTVHVLIQDNAGLIFCRTWLCNILCMLNIHRAICRICLVFAVTLAQKLSFFCKSEAVRGALLHSLTRISFLSLSVSDTSHSGLGRSGIWRLYHLRSVVHRYLQHPAWLHSDLHLGLCHVAGDRSQPYARLQNRGMYMYMCVRVCVISINVTRMRLL